MTQKVPISKFKLIYQLCFIKINYLVYIFFHELTIMCLDSDNKFESPAQPETFNSKNCLANPSSQCSCYSYYILNYC